MELCVGLVATFGYAHVPCSKKHQMMIDEGWLARRFERLKQPAALPGLLGKNGDMPCGTDRFALSGAGLARAAAMDHLRRNFRDYTYDASATLIGLWPSSISRYRE